MKADNRFYSLCKDRIAIQLRNIQPLTVRDKQFEEIALESGPLRNNPDPNKMSSGHSYARRASMFGFDQFIALGQVPVLAIQGSRDQNVSPEDARALIDAIRETGQKNIKYRAYPNLGHGFIDSKRRSQKDKVIEGIQE